MQEDIEKWEKRRRGEEMELNDRPQEAYRGFPVSAACFLSKHTPGAAMLLEAV